ncbi:MAG: HlyC/CorC family transporter [Phycisphaeraceae bacterium]|nr:HlyC/CorC family transporter [Phycisphaeraceae bacterium]
MRPGKMPLTETIVILVMLLFNAVFAAYELALASVNVTRLRELVVQKRPGAWAALQMKNRMEASLAVVQLGITLVAATAAAVGGASADEAIAPWLQDRLEISESVAEFAALAVVVLPLSAITIIAGELVPKTLALRNADLVCLKLSATMRWFAFSVYPVVLGFELVTKQIVRLVQNRVDQEFTPAPAPGLAELLAEARTLRVSRVISAEQARVIEGAGRLTKATVQDILVPPGDIKMLYADGPLTEHMVTVHLEAHTRFLVAARPGDAQSIIGYVNVKDLFFLAKNHPANPNLREITRPLLAISPTDKIGAAFARMMAEHVHLALVRDAGGRVRGMITLEDVLEEVVGDIQDEFDRLPRNLASAGRQWVAGGGVPLTRLREVLSRPDLGPGLAPETSLSDWLTAKSQTTLREGDALTVGGIRVLIRKVRRAKVIEALLDPTANEAFGGLPGRSLGSGHHDGPVGP